MVLRAAPVAFIARLRGADRGAGSSASPGARRRCWLRLAGRRTWVLPLTSRCLLGVHDPAPPSTQRARPRPGERGSSPGARQPETSARLFLDRSRLVGDDEARAIVQRVLVRRPLATHEQENRSAASTPPVRLPADVAPRTRSRARSFSRSPRSFRKAGRSDRARRADRGVVRRAIREGFARTFVKGFRKAFRKPFPGGFPAGKYAVERGADIPHHGHRISARRESVEQCARTARPIGDVIQKRRPAQEIARPDATRAGADPACGAGCGVELREVRQAHRRAGLDGAAPPAEAPDAEEPAGLKADARVGPAR